MGRKRVKHDEYVERYRPDSLITQYEEEIHRLTAEIKDAYLAGYMTAFEDSDDFQGEPDVMAEQRWEERCAASKGQSDG